MVWVEQNIDAYRIVAEILHDLRSTLSKALVAIHGVKWYQEAMPKEVFDRLVERKEREKAIDWYESDYMELVEFASFSDLLEIMDANPDILPSLAQLVPAPSLLHARFIELEVMRHKLGMCRPISDTELSFLGTFHFRFRKAMQAAAEALEARANDARAAPEPEQAPPPAEEVPPPVEELPPPVQEVPPPVEEVPPPEPEPETEEEPAEAVAEPVSDEATPTAEPAPADAGDVHSRAKVGSVPKPPVVNDLSQELGRPATITTPPPATPIPGTVSPPKRSVPEAAARAKSDDLSFPPPVMIGERGQLDNAMEESKHQTVLRELYREVTEIAEGMWTSEVPPPCKVWDKVCVHPWYQKNFSKLGLKPLSDFYGIITKVNTKMREGIARDELQDFLKNANFAQVLLALRDMFQRNNI